MSKSSRNKDTNMIGVVLLLLLLVVFIAMFISNKHDEPGGDKNQTTSLDTALLNQEKSSSRVIKANIELYHALNGEYPFDKTTLLDEVNSNKSEYNTEGQTENLKTTISRMKNFRYTVRGDYQAYKYTYESVNGKAVEVEGSYIEDYH